MRTRVNGAMQAIHEGDWKRAEQIAREHLQEAPDDPNWLTPLAVALQMQRRWEETVKVTEHALERRDDLTQKIEDGPRLRGMWVRALMELDIPCEEAAERLNDGGPGFYVKLISNPAAVDKYTKAFSEIADRIDSPSWKWLAELDPEPVPADVLSDDDVVELQLIIDEDSYHCDGLACGEDLLWLLAAVVPGDSRRAFAVVLDELVRDALSVVMLKICDENLGSPMARALKVAGMTVAAKDLWGLGEDINDAYRDYLEEGHDERRKTAKIIYEVFSAAELGLAGMPESATELFVNRVDKSWTEANIGAEDDSDGIWIRIVHMWGQSPEMAFGGAIADMWPKEPRWNEYFRFGGVISASDEQFGHFFHLPLTDVRKELRQFVKRLAPLVEQYREDPSGLYHAALRVMGKAGPPVPDCQMGLPLE